MLNQVNVGLKDLTGIPPMPDHHPRRNVKERRDYRQRECEKIAASMAVYECDDIFIDMRGYGSLHDNNVTWMHHDLYGGVPEEKDRLRVTGHLVQQWKIHRNDKFAIIRHDDGQLLAVSLAEFVGLGKPEADDAELLGMLSRTLTNKKIGVTTG